MMERGQYRFTVKENAREARVLDGIERHLAAPELVAAFVRGFHAASAERAEQADGRRRVLEKSLGVGSRKILRLVDVLIKQQPSRALREALAEREAEREKIEAAIAALEAERAPVAFHPNAAELYRSKVADFKATPGSLDPAAREKAFVAIRDLVEAIVITPRGKYEPADIEIRGKLAALLAQKGEQPAQSVVKVVAGVGFEPTTFRL
jgi:site-specific DNA recombinase